MDAEAEAVGPAPQVGGGGSSSSSSLPKNAQGQRYNRGTTPKALAGIKEEPFAKSYTKLADLKQKSGLDDPLRGIRNGKRRAQNANANLANASQDLQSRAEQDVRKNSVNSEPTATL